MEAGSLKGIEAGVDQPDSTEEIETGFAVPFGDGIGSESAGRILDGIGIVTDDPEYMGKLGGDGVKTQLKQVDPQIIARARDRVTETSEVRDGTWN